MKKLLYLLLLVGLTNCKKDAPPAPEPDLFLGHWQSVEVEQETTISPGVSTGISSAYSGFVLDVSPTQLTLTEANLVDTYTYTRQGETIVFTSGTKKGINARVRGLAATSTTACSYEELSTDSRGRPYIYRINFIR